MIENKIIIGRRKKKKKGELNNDVLNNHVLNNHVRNNHVIPSKIPALTSATQWNAVACYSGIQLA